MLDLLGNISSVVITVVIVAGFLAFGALFVFEIGTMAIFWIKHSFQGGNGRKEAPVLNRTTRPKKA